jgi:hypothetical protein
MGLFSSIGDFFEDTVKHWDSWLPQVAGGALTMMGMPYIGVPLAGIGSGIHDYQTSGNYGSAALQGLLGAGEAYGGARLLSGMGAGWNAAGLNGGNLMDKAWAAGQGGLFGTYGSGQSLLGANGGGVGLFGPGSLLSSKTLGGLNTASSLLNGVTSMMGTGGGTGGYMYNPITIRPTYGTSYSGYMTPSGSSSTIPSIFGQPGSSTTGVDAATLLNDEFQKVKKGAKSLTWQWPQPWGTPEQ